MPKAASVGLGAFVRLLQGHNVLPARLECRFGQYERLQKCAFVAQEGFGLDLGYTYCLHAYGTFSTSLAIDFSGIARKGMPAGGTPVPAPFDAERLISLVSGRSIEWLAVASAVVHEERFPHASGPGISRILRVTAAYNWLLVYRVARAIAKNRPAPPAPGPAGGHDG